ncbi:hypothetical protein BBP40_001820 [Aspergillus hancockii]|nr:hypothetical protein BBP40_001820 [Aspergillus hancockii]
MRRPTTRSRPNPNRQFTTPPPSDDEASPPSNGLQATSRALQSLLNVSPAPSPRCAKPERLQSPLQIRSTPSARSRRHKDSSKPSPKPSRSANKRKRDRYEQDEDAEVTVNGMRFSTPKRARHVPYDLPLGLSQSDFYSLHSPPVSQSPPSPAHHRQQEMSRERSFYPDAALPSVEGKGPAQSDDPWTAGDDQRLVELVLEKFRLSRDDLEDCARRMGKDDISVGRRWQALVDEGNVGLRRDRRLDESWL